MLKISAVIAATATCAFLLASGSPSVGVTDVVAGADAGVVKVRTIAIRPSVILAQQASFMPSNRFHLIPNFRRGTTRMASLD